MGTYTSVNNILPFGWDTARLQARTVQRACELLTKAVEGVYAYTHYAKRNCDTDIALHCGNIAVFECAYGAYECEKRDAKKSCEKAFHCGVLLSCVRYFAQGLLDQTAWYSGVRESLMTLLTSIA